jgi:penicillin-binding protein 1A
MKQDLTAKDRLAPPSERSAGWPDGRRPKRRLPWLRWIAGGLLGLLAAICVAGSVAGFAAYQHYATGLPSVDGLKSYQPHVMSRVYASDGSLMAELATERRSFAPYSDIPDLVKGAFVSAEDQNFWTHRGIDPVAILRAAVTDLSQMGKGRRPIGASTITQQVAKNMLLGNEVTLTRKIKEALLALRIEGVLSKQRILEIYLNEIYLGEQSYGVAAAAQTYFGKTLDQLTPADAAFLAALPKAPNNYNPYRDPQAAKVRRDWVLDRMASDRVITQDQADAGKQGQIIPPDFVRPELKQVDSYFAEDVRRELVSRFGADATVQNGLMVRTSLDPALQTIAERVLRKGLMDYDRIHGGWRGPVTHVALADTDSDDGWVAALKPVARPGGMAPQWQLAVVLKVGPGEAELGWLDRPVQQGAAAVQPIPRHLALYLSDLAWARPLHDGHLGGTPHHMADLVQPGDVVMVELGNPSSPPEQEAAARARHAIANLERATLRQIPAIEGGLVTVDPRNGRVLALVGGWSFAASQFDRITQAQRQPGSSFKPFVYLTAMDQNILPTQTFLDAPFVMNTPQGQWRPQDYELGFEGPVELRTALEKSLNLVTIRVAEHVGMDNVANTADAFHVADNMPHYLPGAIGAVNTTIMRMAGAYAALDAGGLEVQPTLIDSVQDRDGHVLYQSSPVTCSGCNGSDPNQPPMIQDGRRRIADEQSVFQVVQMMQGVVQRGTGVPAGAGLNRPIAGKTGTTQEFNDGWFIGFTPDLVTAVWFGYDNPASLGEEETGGKIAAPVFHDFMQQALQTHPVLPFNPPAGMFLVANPAGGMDAFKATEDPNAVTPLLSDTQDASTTVSDTGPTAGPPAASATIDSGVGGVY